MSKEIKYGVTADEPDEDGEVCIDIESSFGDNGRHIYLNKEEVLSILSMFKD